MSGEMPGREPAEAPSGLELPADRPRPPVASLRGATRELRLTAALTASLRQAAGREGASLDLLLLAGLAGLLSRYSGSEDLVIGMVIEAAGLTSLLPLRIQWTGDPPFERLVAAADGSLRAALANTDLPLEAPLQVLFAGPGAGPAHLPSGERKLSVDLALSARTVEGGEGEPQLLLTLDYAVDLFDATTAARLLDHYAALLAGAVTAPELPLSRLPLLGESERHQMLVEWNDTVSAFPRRTLHKLFEEQAAARPDAVAVVWDGGALTYGELDRQAGRIARRLRRLGVGPESRVALYLERSAEMVAAVLGVLKAGGAYLPIDLSYPRERLELLLEDAAPVAVVGTTRSLASLPSKAPQLAVDLLAVHPATARDLARRLGARFVPDEPAKALVDRLAGVYLANGGDTRAMMRTLARGAGEDTPRVPQAPAAAEEELSADVPPESLAYVLYTSGSTGTPNGVEVTHEAVVRLVRETGYLPFGSEDVFLQMALMSFDASTLELWGPLANGGCVALPPPGRFALGDLYEQVERHGVTALFLTTGLFHVAVEEGLAGLAGLRHLLTGGDVMSRAHLERAIEALPSVEVIHCYGPTENTVFTSTWRVRLPLAEGSVTIGRLIANGRAYVLDPTLAPVPMGSAGELYLSGSGLARGYLHRRELTAERFLPNPFEEGRLYKTGDLVRWRPDGTLAFLGRHDFQVKVRGFRIEPGEIEAALLRHPQVREAAVVGLAEGGRDHRVVAYYVTEAGAETTREDLRAFLRARLPEHMVPAVFVPLAALPLTNVGKLDRRALPAPEALEPAADEPVTALGARDPNDLGDLVLELLAGLWEDVLDPDPQREPAVGGGRPFERSALEKSRRVGPHDDFFDLGGHSLTVMRLLSRIRQTFGVELGAQTVFAFPTLAAQARVIAAARRGAESDLPPLAKVPRQGLPALSFAQQRLWFLDRLAPESPLYNVPSTYRLAGPLAPTALAAGLSEIVRRHETLRTRFVEVDGEPRQEIGAPWQVPLPQVDLRALGRERRQGELARLRTEEAGRPFRLDRGPLLRAGLVRLDEEEHALLLTVHHIVYDGWSEGVLTAELTALYAAALERRPSPLGELTVQYADFAAWQRAWPPEVLGGQLAWWRDELAGAPATLPLPVDRPRPAAPSVRGASAMLRLPAAEAAALRQAARREGTTLYMLLLAGFAALLARVTGEEDLLVGTPVADRPRQEVEGLIGFFVNTVVIRARAAGDPSFRGLLATVRDTALSAFAHQDLPFEMLVEELRPERERSRNPLVQVLFAFQGAGPATAGTADDAAGLRLVRLPWGERSTAKLDLLLSAMEMPVEPPGESNEAEITLVLEYAADLFTAPTAARFLGHYATLVAGAAASPTSPELPLSSLPLLSAPERHQLVEWNDTASGFPLRPVHHLFEEQARARPDAVAVSWEAGPMRAMSYGELDRRSGEIARRLRRLGVATDARVGLVVERSPEMLEAILGILKAGGGYLPLDPTYPRERLALLLADAAPAAVVGPRRLLAALPDVPNGPGGARRLALEDVDLEAPEADEANAEADTAPTVLRSADVPPTSLAYVIYTSGSTGAPKGVEVSHRGVVRLVREAGYTVFGPGEVYLPLSPMTFDVATLEIWGPLLNGGRLVLLPPGPYTLADIYAAVARQGVTTLWLASALFNLAVEEGLEPLSGLRLLEAGGDVVSRPHVERAIAALPGAVDLMNGYGPTENTMFSTTHRLRGGLAPGEASVPIGRPISASSAYVLDRALRPLPVACVGELYVGGAGVARGYLGRPALTAERFVPDPFSADPWDPRGGDRLYRTGDLARWRPDGTLDFLGRRDFQVKVRGFRVELGEVESALLRHPGVRDAVVTAVSEAAGGHRLVAYYVPEGVDGGGADGPIPPTSAELRIHLRESLPEHMVPSLFMPLAELPLNANGKVDRRALPAPEAVGEEDTAPRTPPRNPVEEVIAGIWEDLLGLDPQSHPVGVDDDFFHLGGHSLLAIRLLARLRAVLGADVPVQQVFDAPTIAGLAEAVARALASGDGAAGPALPPLAPRAFADTGSADAAAPLSYAQQRLWFLDRLAPGSPAYNVPSAYGLAGPLAPAALAAALAEVVRRHEILRARFVERDGEPRLEIAEALAPGFLPLVDLSTLAPGRRSAELARLRAEEAERPFDLAAGPLLRTGLVRLGAEEHVLLLNFHHAVYDGWSEGVLLRELAALYDSARAARAARRLTPSPLAEPVLQYADFVAWQRAWPPEVLGRQLAYWRGQLAGAPTALELPADRPRPAVASLRGAGRRRLLGAPEVARLHQVARREGATLYMLLLAAFAATLARHGGQEDVLVATPVANRARPELEGLIGFFVNTLVLRVRLADDPDFRRVLASVRQTALTAFAHQDLPFEALVEEFRPERDLSRAPLVQAMLSLGRAAPGRPLGGDLHLTRLPSSEKTTAKLDLSLGVTELEGEDGGQSLLLELEYATDLFTATAAERLLAHFATLLRGAAEAPELPLSRLPLLAPAERHQLVAEWNDTASGFPERTLHGLFGEQAAARPDAVAVSWEAGEMSYGELDRRSGEIARHLRRLGVAPDAINARVALVTERSPEMVAALLGILKAGGGYLPLDPSYPRERLALLLADAAPAAVVGPRHLLAALPDLPIGPDGAPRLAFEDALSEADAGADAPLAVLRSTDVPPAGLAYVLYTSGSTGTPKGVEVSHRAVVRLVRDTAWAAFGPGEVFLQLSPMSFDLATFEIWGPLLHGGRLALLPPGPFTVTDVYAAVARHGVTTLWLTSGLFHLAVEEGLAPLGGLRQLVAGGDVLSRPHVERALAALPDVDLINGYGPTENTTFSTTHRLRDGLPAGEPSVPIGRPIAASRAYVLDHSLRPLPAGCVGELYVGGAGVARGYLGRPALTAERFVPDPFSADPWGENRLYRTGDLARWRPDGTFDFLGRADFQVKVRGFRVEPGEVESALLGHPGVREAVVTAAKEAAGGHRLVAYYVPEGADGPAPADLRLHLRESLPEHMVPSLFVPLAELPLNANGKVDRRALPSPESVGEARPAGEARLASEADTAPRTPPRNPVEEVIAGIWEDLLGLDPLKHPVGVDDDFFHLGGHSLLVTRLLSRLRQAFGADLPVQRVFAAPTVAGLAAAISAILAAGRREEALPPLPPITPLPSRHGVLPLSYPQRRLYFMDRLAPESPTYNISSGYLLRGPFAPAALAAALAEAVRRHEALRTRIVAVSQGEPGQEVDPPPTPAPLPLADLSGLPPARRAAELAALASREAGRGFDLRRDPMLRATLVRLGDHEHAFLFTVHHIASDGWSEGVLRRELSALYAAALAGEPSPLAPLPLQYADFAAWQRAWPEEALAAQLAHWKERLAGTPALDLPADRPRPPVASFRGNSLRLDLPPALADAFRRLARRGQATVFMTVLAVWHALLQRHSGQTDFAVGTPVANRTRPELEPLIGVFLNMLALRTDGGGDPSFAELLARVRHTALAAYDHADVPFERIVDEVNVARDRSRPPLVQTMLALNSTPRVPLTLRGLAVEPLDLSARVSRFDLSLALSEQGGELGGGLEYSTDLFDRTSMERLAGHFLHLLAAAADDPSRRVAEMELLSPAERQQVAVELNDTAADLSAVFGGVGGIGGAEPLLHRWIERQAALTPGATAVVGESESLTYRELDARANRLARRLRRLGVRVDEPVAICADRSPALIVGLLAILKAGGAYLPLDPSYPSERLAFMIEDGLDGLAKPVLLAQVDLLSATVAGAGARLIDLDSAAGPAGDADNPLLAPLDGGAGADNLAYVIYTSGSTGRPKGVMSTHRGIVNRIAWMQRAYGLTPADRVLQKTPVSFDVSVWELFWPLVVGARLVLARPGGHRDPAYLMRRIEEQEVTTLHFVPSMLQVFLAQPGLGRCRSLRRVMASGEALPAELAARFHELLGGALGTAGTIELHNLYGPTEASVDVTAHRTLPGPARRTVPIGRPIENLGIWLLDSELQPVPLGVPGELYIGGTGLARGYLRRPGLTAERFVPHPLGRPGERLYRTGDLARFSADGEIEFLGRNDDQVKLRGFRIEPGEIEAALAGHPAVREAAVVAREEGPGEVRLAAWVVPAGPGPRPEAGELRDALRRVLPEHMVPADFAFVDALPLTPNGKVDRGALRARLPAGELAPAAEAGDDLETEIEELVAGIWQDLLRRGTIGRDDNLFDVGAHSILAIEFASRVYDALGLEIPLRLAFESPTVRRLAAAIQELLIEQVDSLTDEEAELLAE